MALTSGAPDNLLPTGGASRRTPDHPRVANGLGLIGGLAVIPHFDQMERWRPGALEWFASWQPPGTTLLGIEEKTAVVALPGGWQVQGTGAAWVLDPGGNTRFVTGEEVPLPPLSVPAPDGPGPGA